MNNDEKILRKLAYEYKKIAELPRNAELVKLHTAVNDLKMIRPIVTMAELPWHELNVDGSLTLQCKDPVFKNIEKNFRQTLFQFKYFPADMIVRPYVKVQKVVKHSSIGVEIDETTLHLDADNHISSHQYKDQFEEDDSINLLKDVVVTYDKEETMKRFTKVATAIGDIIPIHLGGIAYIGNANWDVISRLRGVTAILIDLLDRPEFMMDLIERFTQIKEGVIAQYEELGLLDYDPDNIHCTSPYTSDLPAKDYVAGEPLKCKDVWGRGAAQIFGSVSKEMHDEYDIEFMKRTVGKCGLVYYGCCEPLDKKVDIVEKIPNLRKISITPWADVANAAEVIGKKYVIASKPNPANVATSILDQNVIKAEIGNILNSCKKNSCNVELTLKDISTCKYSLQTLIDWEKVTMDMIKNY
ncbi:MAG: hypothetical protein ATN31_11285 [Candidatus Epulonipiscioides saccharophilum]|nr:MAG: hypothetical protein ATN31_11285 [Epulopiscium sp. AS2M-Bin001]